ncbi:MAG: glycoside hydrolase family 127 protein [Phycisphaerae bacterium]|nr:glycoside hydrolase family 127 protein [Phycisphaerae bacterium]
MIERCIWKWQGNDLLWADSDNWLPTSYTRTKDKNIQELERKLLQVNPLPLEDVRLLSGPLKKAQDLNKKTLLALEPDRLMAGYRIRAGLTPKAKGYGGWDSVEGKQLTGHIAGHWLSGVSLTYAATGDQRFKELADYLVREMKIVQDKRGNGYLGAIANKDGMDGAVIFEQQVARGDIHSSGFDLNGMWSPWYTLHKTFAGLRDAYRYTGNSMALQLEIKFAEWAQSVLSDLPDKQIQKMLNTEFGGMNEIFADLYADTGDDRWLEMSYKFEHKSFIEPLMRHEDNLAGKHGNTQVPKLIGSIDRFIYTGKATDAMAAGFFWDSVVGHHTFATGGHGKDEYFDLPDKMNDCIEGRTCETCNVYNMLKLTRRLFAINPSGLYADFLEQALFNHILASLDPTDGWACYMVPVGRGVRHEYERNMTDGGFTCCTGTSLESHALHGDGIYFESDDMLYVNMFVPSTVAWKSAGVHLKVETDFPEGESVRIEVSPKHSKRFALVLRRPFWAGDGFAVKINGHPVDDKLLADPYVQGVGHNLKQSGEPDMHRPSYYIHLDRTWNDGDIVEVTLPKTLRLLPLKDNSNRVAIAWGPLVLAGDLGPENQAKPERIPVFVAKGKPISGWLKPVEGKLGHFKSADGVGQPSSVEMVPFYRLHRRIYAIYWDLFSTLEWQKCAAVYAAEEKRQLLFEKATVGYAQPGEMQPERNYNFQSDEQTSPVRIEGRPGRKSRNWFSFDMPVDQSHPMTLVVTYYSAEHSRWTTKFRIFADGELLADEHIKDSKPERFFDVEYELSSEMIKAKNEVTIRFEALEGAHISAIFGLRMIRGDIAGSSE